MTVYQAKRLGIENFSLLVSHVRVPPAIEAIMTSPGLPGAGVPRGRARLHGDGHRRVPGLAERFGVPIVVTGFEPLDILEGIRRTVRQLEEGRHEVENAYPRAVSRRRQPGRACRMLEDVFEVVDRAWRGIGMIPQSGLAAVGALPRLRRRGALRGRRHPDRRSPRLCRSGEVLQGLIKPHECAAFGTPVHAAQPARRDDGLQRGRLRRLLPLPADAAADRRRPAEVSSVG